MSTYNYSTKVVLLPPVEPGLGAPIAVEDDLLRQLPAQRGRPSNDQNLWMVLGEVT